MKIDFTGRGFDINERIRTFTQAKMDKIKKHIEEVHDVSVVLSVEKYRQKAEIKFSSNKKSFFGSGESNDMFLSIDRVVDKLEAQVKKFKEKNTSRKRNTHESIRNDQLPMVETQLESPRQDGEILVIPTEPSQIKPMNVEEAVDEMTKLEQEFLVFRNADSNDFNVVFRRKDGHIGYVSPSN